jgi:alkylation response protein AidB-like acyl-CoA dehydrogenase
LSSDLDALGESIATVLQDVCDRRAVHDFTDGKSDLDNRLWSQAAELGWLACAIPEAAGGLGMGPAGLDLLHRELGKALAPGPFLSTLAAAQWLAEVGDSAQKDRYLPAIMVGEMTVAVPAQMGVSQGPSLRMLGSRTAGLAILPGKDGSASLVELGADEARLTPVETWDRTRQICDLELTDLPTGSPAQGLDRLYMHLAQGVASDSLGAARSIAQQTVEYLKTREQFGRPIGSFQALKHRAADLFASLAVQDRLQAQAVSAVARDADAMLWVSLAKAGATEAAAFIAGDCVQLHGGVGHTWEFDPHLFLKRTRLNEALVAPNMVMRDLAADRLVEAVRQSRSTAEMVP